MKSKLNIFFVLLVVIVCVVFIGFINIAFGARNGSQDSSVTVKDVSQQILASGSIASQNEATLHFQTAGKLTYLAAKEGDRVYSGEVIARLDNYALTRNLEIAANAYQIAKNSTSQTQENNNAGVLEGQTRNSLDTYNKNSYDSTTEAQVVTDTVKRLVDNANLTQNTASLNVDLANYALQLSSLTAPFSGIVIHEDVNTPNTNILATTNFEIIDPNALVFRANINEQDIDFVSVGAKAHVTLDSSNKTYSGIVTKIYPEKITLSTGQEAYQVDIESPEFVNLPYDSTGSVQIDSNAPQNDRLVPAWTVLNDQSIWVNENGKQILKKVTVGKSHGDYLEILNGLSENDKVIVDPKKIIESKYTIL